MTMDNVSYEYNLPGQTETVKTSRNAVVFIGANGAGKTHLGSWMERKESTRVCRITALRNLTFSTNLPAEGLDVAVQKIWFGGSSNRNNHDGRYNWIDNEYAYEYHPVNDYDHVLAAVNAKENLNAREYYKNALLSFSRGGTAPEPKDSPIDILKQIWTDAFPSISLEFTDSQVFAFPSQQQNNHLDIQEDHDRYLAYKMSDGERAGLYLISQAICVPQNSLVLIDEPELHLHPSIMSRLWSSIESHRPDCLFLYFTHDTRFAASRAGADKYWVHGFDGKEQWQLQKLPENELPEALLLEILGNRKPVIFVEGGLDVKLYSLLFPEHYIIECGGCQKVIEQTKAFRATESYNIHQLDVSGIIDRDSRSDDEIEQLLKQGIRTLKVAEVENLFLVEGVLKVIEEQFFARGAAEKAKRLVVETKFMRQKDSLQKQDFTAAVKQQLSGLDITNLDADEIKKKLEEVGENLTNLTSAIEKEYASVAESHDYEQVLKLLKAKETIKDIDTCFRYEKKGVYLENVLEILQTGNDAAKAIKTAMLPFIPSLPET